MLSQLVICPKAMYRQYPNPEGNTIESREAGGEDGRTESPLAGALMRAVARST